MESCFGSTLLLKSSSISFFLCILVYEILHSSILENPSRFIYFLGFALIAFSKIAIPHYFGQRVINKSEEINSILYDKPWCQYKYFQRKNMATMMTYNQVKMKINVMGFYDLDLANLGAVIQHLKQFIQNK